MFGDMNKINSNTLLEKINRQNETFEKVIFLDVDGVLNRDRTSGQENEPIIEPEFVDNLAEIIRRTDARIVLSSSWRSMLVRLKESELPEDERLLLSSLAERDLHISGITPSISSGPESRPLEINDWLSKKKTVKSFVILDDDTFWMWGSLLPNVVTTSRYIRDERWGKKRLAGLEKQYIEPAVRILNKPEK